MLGALADHKNQLGLIVERLGHLRADDRLAMGNERGCPAHEDGRKFRNVVALGAFLDMFEVIEAEADDLAGPGYGEPEFDPLEGAPRARGRALGRFFQRREIAVTLAQDLA